MKAKSSLLLLIIGLVAIGCDGLPDRAARTRVDLKEFGEMGFYYKFFRSKQAQLGLSDLRNGFDSLQLRVWWQFSFSDSADVFVIKKEPFEKWSSSRMRFPIEIDSTCFGYRKLTSTNGKEIWQKLDELGINEFNGMDSVAMGRYCDGEIAVIEIATKSSYRFCSSESSLTYTSGKEAEEVKEVTEYLECLFSGMELPEETAWRVMLKNRK